MKQSKIRKAVTAVGVVIFWLLLWQLFYILLDKEILLASPFKVFERILSLVLEKDFWQTVSLSFLRIFCGYISAVFFGVLIATLMSFCDFLKAVLSPLITLSKSVPVASFIILLLVWVKKDAVPVVITFLIVMPIIASAVSEGIFSTDKILLDVAKVYNFSFFKTVKTVYLKSVLPPFAAAATTSLGLAWKSGVAAEVIAMPVSSVGYNLYRAKINIETVDLFAWTAVVVILSVVLEKIIKKIIRNLSKGVL